MHTLILLAKFGYRVSGKLLYMIDALSLTQTSPATATEVDSLQDDAELFFRTVVSSLPAS